MTSGYDISVVIPTRNRWPMLERTLRALAEQEPAGLQVEVVVVDNGSSDGSWERLERAAAGDDGQPFSLRALREPVAGAGPARNAGLVAASSDVVLFLGDDCPPGVDNLVAGHAAAHADGDPLTGVVGHTEWDPGTERTAVMDWLERTGKQFDFERAEREGPGPFLFYTANLSLRRAAALQVGGFDERFGTYGWEDFELGMRLAEWGFQLSYRRDLVVHHVHRYDVRASLARMEAMGRTARLFNRLYPDEQPPPAPRVAGPKGFVGRLLAPMLTRLPVPDRLPRRLHDEWLRVAHYAALARGYGRSELRTDEDLVGRLGPDAARVVERPPVSVIVPCGGDEARGLGALKTVMALQVRSGDQLILVDNSPNGLGLPEDSSAELVRASEERSAYYARNVGVEHARHDWLLFLDDDCDPRATLLDEYFRAPIPDRCGALAGPVVADRPARLAPRYAASRGYLSQSVHLRHGYRSFAITANLLVRRDAWASVGGFQEGITSGGDSDFCWRIQEVGWTVGLTQRASVVHRHRVTMQALLRQVASYTAGHEWLNRSHPGSSPRRHLARGLIRSAAAGAAWFATAHFERAVFKALDAAVVIAEFAGWFMPNVSPRGRPRGPSDNGKASIVFVADSFPELSQTFVTGEIKALQRGGHHVRVEAAVRPLRPNREGARGVRVDYLSDDGLAGRFLDLLWLVVRHPVGCLVDMASRHRWRREDDVRRIRALATRARRITRAGERHLHVHFADTASLDALRLGRLLGLPFSMTAHAYDIFSRPQNLREKLVRATFAAGESMYATEYLRRVAGPEHAADIHFLPAGVDGRRFRRRAPHPGDGTVVSVGRLVEKKGFRYLIEAVALVGPEAPLGRVLVAGDGPLAESLTELVERLRVGSTVELLGARDHDEVRDLLERADVLAVPCVIAADGDRDSMPNVVYEALAMELPLVASREVGLPEAVRPEWGRLVPAADPRALAGALADVLSLSAEERTAMGQAGRRWVLAERDVDAQADMLAELVLHGRATAPEGGEERPAQMTTVR